MIFPRVEEFAVVDETQRTSSLLDFLENFSSTSDKNSDEHLDVSLGTILCRKIAESVESLGSDWRNAFPISRACYIFSDIYVNDAT